MFLVAFMYLILGLLGLYTIKRVLNPRKKHAPLPPGPKGKPIVGNIADLPPPGAQEWLHWLKFKDPYGK
jgi:hypothetical protein